MTCWLRAFFGLALLLLAASESFAQGGIGGVVGVGPVAIPDDELKEVLDESLRSAATRRLRLGEHSPSEILQAVRAFGLAYQLRDESGVNLIKASDWLKAGAPLKGQPCWQLTDGSIRFQTSPQSHPHEVLAGLLILRSGYGSEELTEMSVMELDGNSSVQQFSDFVLDETVNFDATDVTSFVLARCYSSNMEKTWQTRDGRKWSVEDIVELLLRQIELPSEAPLTRKQSLALQSLAVACFRYREVHDIHPSRRLLAVWGQAEARLKVEFERARPVRSNADMWSFGRLDDTASASDRLRATARDLTWINHASSRKQLQFQGTRRVVEQLARDLLAQRETANVTDFFDAAHALNQYRSRTRQVSLSAAALPRRLVPRVIAPPPVPVDKQRLDLGEVTGLNGFGAGLDVAVCNADGWVEQTLKCDAQGRFRIPRTWTEDSRNSTAPRVLVVKDADQRVGWFSLRERAWQKHAFADDESIEEPVLIDIHLHDCNRSLRGRVVDADQQPLSGVRVEVASLWNPVDLEVRTQCADHAAAALLAMAVTDNEGRFELRIPTGVAGGVRFLHREWTLGAGGTVEFVPTDSDLGKIQMAPSGSLRGTLIDRETLQPLTQFPIKAVMLQGTAWHTQTDAHGHFEFAGLKPDVHEIKLVSTHATAPWVLTNPVTLKVTANRTLMTEIKVARGHRVTGTVVEEASLEPVGTALISATDGTWWREIRADSRGDFEIYVPPGKFTVVATDAASPRERSVDAKSEIVVSRDRPLDPLTLKLGARQLLPQVRRGTFFGYSGRTGHGLDDASPPQGTGQSFILLIELHLEPSARLGRWKAVIEDRITKKTLLFERVGQVASLELPLHLKANRVELRIEANEFEASEVVELIVGESMPLLSVSLKSRKPAE